MQTKHMIVIGTVLALIFMLGSVVVVEGGQDKTVTASATTPPSTPPIPMKPELRDKFLATYYKKVAAQRTLDLLWERFIIANPEAKKVQEDFQQADAALGTMLPELFKSQGDGVALETHRIEPDAAEGPRFVAIDPAISQAAKD